MPGGSVRRWLWADSALRAVGAAVRNAGGEMGVDKDCARLLARGAAERFEAYMRSQPLSPPFVSATRAAEMLSVQPPHLARLRRQGRMPPPVPVEGGHDVYLKEEVTELADQLRSERKARRQRTRGGGKP